MLPSFSKQYSALFEAILEVRSNSSQKKKIYLEFSDKDPGGGNHAVATRSQKDRVVKGLKTRFSGQWCYAKSQKEAQDIFDNNEGQFSKVPDYDQETKRKAISVINSLMDDDETVGREIDRLSQELDKIHSKTMTDENLEKWAARAR